MILVTGGTGFIGSRITSRLLDLGESVLCLDAEPLPERLGSNAGHSDVSFVKADITRFDDLVRGLKAHPVERIIHTAAVLGKICQEQPYVATRVNVQGTMNVLELGQLLGAKRVVYASSMIVYGDQSDHGDVDIDEDAPLHPSSLYAHTKLMNEVAARQYRDSFGLDAVGLRICTPFGYGRVAGGGAGGAVSTLIGLPARNQPVRLDLSPDEKPPCIYVEDLAEIFVRLTLEPEVTMPVYLCSATPASLKEIADIVREFIPEADISLTDGGPTVPHVNRIDARRLEEDTGYTLPPLRTRVRDLIDVVRTVGRGE